MKFHKYHLLLAIPLLSISVTVNAQVNVQTFWSDYPPCEEQCHESVFNSQQCTLENSCGCSGDCLCLNDLCLCETSSWLIAVAQCIGQSCGAADVTTAASILQSACNGNGLALAVGTAVLISSGLAAIPSPTTQAPVETTTSEQPQVVTVTNTPVASPNPTTPQASTTSSPQSSTMPTSTPGLSSTTSSSSKSDSSTTSPPSTTLSTTTSSTSPSSSSSSTPVQVSSSGSPSNGTLTGIIIPCILGGLAIIAGCTFWLVKPETARKYFKNACCCCCIRDEAAKNTGVELQNQVPRRDLRGVP